MAGILNNDRKLGAEVRRMTLNKLKDILGDDEHKKYDEKFQREVLLKLATNALPRLNEHTGEDGGPLSIRLVQYGDNYSASIHAEGLPTTTIEGDGQRTEESSDRVASP